MKLNGIDHPDFSGTVDQFVQSLAIRREGIAVAVNGEIVPRSQWSNTLIDESAEIEIVTAAAGG